MTNRFRYHSLTLKNIDTAVEAGGTWLTELARNHGLSEEKLFQLNQCACELITNIVTHAYKNTAGEINLCLLLDLDSATLSLVDSGPAFDPVTNLQKTAPADGQVTASRGLNLVQQLTDQIHYERCDQQNRLTIRIGCLSLPQRKGERRIKESVSFPLLRQDNKTIEANERSGLDRRSMGFVSRTRLFRGVAYQDLQHIISRCEIRDAQPNEILFKAGEYHHCVLVVMEGSLEVRLDGPKSNFCVKLNPGECVGELSVADGKPVSAWIVAAEPCRLLVIPEAVFLGPVLGITAIARNLIVLLSERMRRSNEQIIARMRATLELESLKRELDVARQIQSGMLPTAPLFLADAGIVGRGFMRAARHVGGDFYDAFPLPDGRFFIAIGDVCNKGAPAALYMMRTLTILRNEAVRPITDIDQHLARLATRSNDLLNEANEAQQFVTMFFAIIDVPAGRLHCINAGHNLPILQYPGGQPAFIECIKNPFAGLFTNIEYRASSCDFPAGSLLLLYTDGVTEAEADEGVFFGDEALLQLLAEEPSMDADACVEHIVSAIDRFAGEHPQSDDITLLAIHRPSPAPLSRMTH